MTPSCRAGVQVGELGPVRPRGLDQVGTREVEEVVSVWSWTIFQDCLTGHGRTLQPVGWVGKILGKGKPHQLLLCGRTNNRRVGLTTGCQAEGEEAGATENVDHAHGEGGNVGEAGNRTSRITTDYNHDQNLNEGKGGWGCPSFTH